MSKFNQLSRYGAVAKAMPHVGPQGKVFFVGSTSSAWYGDFEQMFPVDESGVVRVHSTVDAAMASCTASRGDVVMILPGYTETVTATTPALDVAGVTVICLGNGSNAPTFTFGAAAATINVSAANVKWIGGIGVGNFADVASAFTTAAAKNFTLDGMSFRDASGILNFLSIVTTNATDNAADDLTVINNSWHGLNTTPLAFVSILAAELRPTISNNFMNHAATSGAEFVTLAAKIVTGARIENNTQLVVGATGTTTGIFLTGSGSTSTGIVAGNRSSSLDTTTELMFTAGTGLVFFDNLYTGVADKSGYILPAIDSAA